ncbi:hypothetical protein F2P81_005438 [Scophthalmus maximus]|uniref:Uncharacterized protein n=1 Tax=Scophthalmus maximus TaxID=52904 RepID=A0A6A4T340_SCOMX|nr:hypothetical protein F2P81_005438 [Scophthalmus maximus]
MYARGRHGNRTHQASAPATECKTARRNTIMGQYSDEDELFDWRLSNASSTDACLSPLSAVDLVVLCPINNTQRSELT